ncbi:hypothetical protein ACFV3E_45410 [Streptomyces sp. NPDC059718]
MTDAASHAPHADPILARDCANCLGWGTVITTQDSHELCPHCQPPARQADPKDQ